MSTCEPLDNIFSKDRGCHDHVCIPPLLFLVPINICFLSYNFHSPKLLILFTEMQMNNNSPLLLNFSVDSFLLWIFFFFFLWLFLYIFVSYDIGLFIDYVVIVNTFSFLLPWWWNEISFFSINNNMDFENYKTKFPFRNEIKINKILRI